MIEVDRIEKTFQVKRSIREILRDPLAEPSSVRALRGVDLRVEAGEIFALLGPNGAGKTTLLKILSCLVLPDRGRALVGGEDTVHEGRVKPKIGLVHSDERSFYWRLSARQNLRFFARLYDVPSKRIESRIGELLERVGLEEAADRPFSDYSSGMKQRVAIIRALLHDPPILLMDEPTRSLDPNVSRSLRRFIEEDLKQRDGKTILLATHNLREAEAIADRVAILAEGTVRQVGTVDEVRRWGMDGNSFRLELDAGTGPLEGPFELLSERTEDGTRWVTIRLDPEARLDDLLQGLFASGVVLRSCDRVEPDLEEAFARILESGEEPS